MNKENIKKTLSHSLKKSAFCQISRKKICILPNSMGKKSVFTDKISMSGRSAYTCICMWSNLGLFTSCHYLLHLLLLLLCSTPLRCCISRVAIIIEARVCILILKAKHIKHLQLHSPLFNAFSISSKAAWTLRPHRLKGTRKKCVVKALNTNVMETINSYKFHDSIDLPETC